jgi:hypothetical protein
MLFRRQERGIPRQLLLADAQAAFVADHES